MRRSCLIVGLTQLALTVGVWAEEAPQQAAVPLSADAAIGGISYDPRGELGSVDEAFSEDSDNSLESVIAQDLAFKRFLREMNQARDAAGLAASDAAADEVGLFDALTLSAKLLNRRGTDLSKLPGTVSALRIQSFRKEVVAPYQTKSGGRGTLSLTNVNPAVNLWYILTIAGPVAGTMKSYHLENLAPSVQSLDLDLNYSSGIVVVRGQDRSNCELWGRDSDFRIAPAQLGSRPFVSLCAGRVYLRNKIEGNQTTKEWVTDFLRSNIWGGEQITTFVKETFFKDHFLLNGGGEKAAQAATKHRSTASPDGPREALLRPAAENRLVEPRDLGIAVEQMSDGKLIAGKWHPTKFNPSIYLSTITPEMISDEIMQRNEKQVSKLDAVEMSAMSYLVAFDLSQYRLGFSLGTDHPRVAWSERAGDAVVDFDKPGPDGIASTDPFVSLGIVSPEEGKLVAATFTGGFKRDHGAMKWGPLSQVNGGSHYGFIEKGTVLSRLQPELATLVGYNDGTIDMLTWSSAADARLKDIVFARQNGVPLLSLDESSGQTVPGALLSSWGTGNWSGSQDRKFRTLRAGVCIADNGGHRFLIYGYFSTMTPSGMARIFQAYQCRYGMHLDMNALEHTYLALYPPKKKGKSGNVQHLITGMNVLDKEQDGQEIPRFIGLPDNRDFFYLMHKTAH